MQEKYTRMIVTKDFYKELQKVAKNRSKGQAKRVSPFQLIKELWDSRK